MRNQRKGRLNPSGNVDVSQSTIDCWTEFQQDLISNHERGKARPAPKFQWVTKRKRQCVCLDTQLKIQNRHENEVNAVLYHTVCPRRILRRFKWIIQFPFTLERLLLFADYWNSNGLLHLKKKKPPHHYLSFEFVLASWATKSFNVWLVFSIGHVLSRKAKFRSLHKSTAKFWQQVFNLIALKTEQTGCPNSCCSPPCNEFVFSNAHIHRQIFANVESNEEKTCTTNQKILLVTVIVMVKRSFIPLRQK